MYIDRKLKHYFNIHCRSPRHIVWGSLTKHVIFPGSCPSGGKYLHQPPYNKTFRQPIRSSHNQVHNLLFPQRSVPVNEPNILVRFQNTLYETKTHLVVYSFLFTNLN